ncbi:diaminopimelate epimerase [Tepidimonas charontis]|uniref:Diaminopimelate epimerase n=1 Tax=Tepidimonas charontis TaxID=2267262 RepID=A0A554XIY2_9BURK|nr:diaminopimelate epimerase [Tepidimonas charontis]TSE35749.1 Diaminopimelate epimerase [Tepidimonas charontis]
MRVRFTKMQGAGNDFIVLDETRERLGLSAAQYRWLADRHFGVGADQILSVRAAPDPSVDFEYVIHNADGGEVENCGNGARCFVRYVHDAGLTQRRTVRVRTRAGVLTLALQDDGRVTVDMGAPVFEPAQVPFVAEGLPREPAGDWWRWCVPLGGADGAPAAASDAAAPPVGAASGVVDGAAAAGALCIAVLSMGNPHAVLRVDDVERAPVATWGPWLERHPRFPRRVNVGFLQVVDRGHARLRVYERGAGETLACGTGACAAVVAGIRLGWFDERVDVQLRGGVLTIEWPRGQGLQAAVRMTGPAEPVFTGEVEIPPLPPQHGA